MTNEEAHTHARGRGVTGPLYAIVRTLLVGVMRVFWGLRIEGAERIPAEGATIIAPNHKSFWDAFFIAPATRRHVRFMGKSELFEGRLGRTFVRLGAFPVVRGHSDEQALETARTILRQDGLLALFPEGTRVRGPDELGEPKRGAARLALETGATLVPAALTGTERMFWHGIPRPTTVRVAFGEPIEVTAAEPTPEAANDLLSGRLWPEVEGEFSRLRAHPGLIAAGLAAVGLGAAVARRRSAKKSKRRSFRLPRTKR